MQEKLIILSKWKSLLLTILLLFSLVSCIAVANLPLKDQFPKQNKLSIDGIWQIQGNLQAKPYFKFDSGIMYAYSNLHPQSMIKQGMVMVKDIEEKDFPIYSCSLASHRSGSGSFDFGQGEIEVISETILIVRYFPNPKTNIGEIEEMYQKISLDDEEWFLAQFNAQSIKRFPSKKIATHYTETKRASSPNKKDVQEYKSIKVHWRAPHNIRLLLVGVSDYNDNAIPKITFAKSDAQHFFSFAQSAGIPAENINSLTNEQASRSEITDGLIKLKMATTEKNETAIFYFSGHGAPIVKNGKIVDAALVPYDAKENSLEYTGIKITMLHNILSNVRGNWIVILDACFSGKEGRSLMAKNVKAIAVVPKDFNIVPKSENNIWWLTSTSGDNFANDFPKENSGLFTHYFLKALNGEKGVDSNGDGLISMMEAFSYTKKEVKDVSAKSLGRFQLPELIGEGDTILTIPR